MSDLIERLREVLDDMHHLTAEVHDEIERLTARIEELEGALQRIALDTVNPTNETHPKFTASSPIMASRARYYAEIAREALEKDT